jgi:RNA polymerase sigma-70 factor (ECF subfamily)
MDTIQDFERLIQNYSEEIFVYLWRLHYNVPDAEDDLQETFLRAFRAYPRLRDGSNPRAWLYKIATNVAYTHLKRLKRSGIRLDEIDLRSHPTQPSVLFQVEQKELLSAVWDAVQALPEKQSAAFVMRKYQGLSYSEIADALQCNPDTARANVYQALKKILLQFPEIKYERDLF